MFVNIESADLHVQLEEENGRPLVAAEWNDEVYGHPPLTTEPDEVFGPYELNGKDVFWRYTAASKSWDVVVSDANADMSSITSGDDAAEHKRLLETIRSLRIFPRPECCSTPDVLTQGQSFTFNNCVFCWYWFPELDRWELARRGRA